jgi:hypothetical protein
MLVGHDAGQQGEPAGVGRGVDWVQVAARPLADLEPRRERRAPPGQEVHEPHRRVLGAEAHAVLFVAEPVEPQVETRTCAELEQPQR